MFLQIVDTIRQRFIARGFTEVSVDEGIESRNAQSNFGAGGANRVCFVPSSDPWPVIAPTFIGEADDDKRQLLNVMFVYDVSFAGYDADHPERDLSHIRKCFDIFEVTAQEVQLAYSGAFAWSALKRTTDKKHITHGAELVAKLTLNIPIFDLTYVSASPTAVPGQPKPVT